MPRIIKKKKKPTKPRDVEEWFACPECGQATELDAFEVGGADEGNVFCNSCSAEISLDSMKPVDKGIYLLDTLSEKYPGISEPLQTIREAYLAKGT